MPTYETYLANASDALAAGFASEAARKRALECITRAHDCVREAVMNAILWAERYRETKELQDLYWSVPSILPKAIAPKHAGLIAFGYNVADLIELRAQIKAAEIVKIERPQAEIEAKADEVRKTIADALAARQASFVETLCVARHFKGLPVSVTAHYVHGHKGGRWLRHFYYVAGKLTALQVIMAAADAYEREVAA